jgi:two-component system OmpR family sensor kinase
VTPLRLRTRITAWYSLVLAIILVVFALTITWQQGAIGLRRVDRELAAMTATLSTLLGDELSESDTPELAATEVVQTLAATGQTVAIEAASGHRLAAAPGAPLLESMNAAGNSDRIWTTTSADNRWRVNVRRQPINGDEYVLIAAAPLADTNRERREAQEAMWLGMPVLLLLSAGGGLWLASVALRPISDMARRAGAIRASGAEDLGRSGRTDELGQLEAAFNGLLARLRASLQTQRQFMADASHELRTPISVIQSVADVTLDRPHRDEAEYRDALSMIGVQTGQATRLLDDMLMLARADAGGYPLRPVSLYLNELVLSCRDAIAGQAGEQQVALRASAASDLPFVGDEDLLRRMVLNLIQNAVQHTKPQGSVEVTLKETQESAVITVSDEGPGVPEADRDRIFARFVQLDPARRRSGAGLGLPISRWIAEAHHGRLELQASSPSGSTFAVTLPK